MVWSDGRSRAAIVGIAVAAAVVAAAVVLFRGGPATDATAEVIADVAPAPPPAEPPALRGRVVDADGAPVEGARVVLCTDSVVGGADLHWIWPVAAMAEATTNADGEFSFADLDCRDDYGLRISHVDHATTYAEHIVVCRDESVIVPETTLEGQTWVDGVVTSGDGTTITGATVEVRQLLYIGDAPAIAVGTTHEDGSYRLRSAGESSIVVHASAPGLAPGTATRTSLYNPRMDRRVDFTLYAPESIEGVVVDESGAPVAFAEVRAHQVLGSSRPKPQSCEGSATSDGDGRFRCAALAPGDYELVVRQGESRPVELDSIPTGTSNVRIVLPRTGGVAGRIVTHDGTTPTDFTVRLKEVRGDVPVSPQIFRDVESTDGTFVCEGLEPGDYILIAWVDGYAPGESAPFFVERGAVTQGIVVEVGAESAISGRVVDEHGEPVCGARVAIGHDVRNPILDLFGAVTRPKSRRPDMPRTITSHDGSFRIGGLATGSVELQLEHRDHTPILLDDVELTAGQTTDLRPLIPPAGGTVIGVCVDSEDQLLPRCEVWALRQSPPWTRVTRTDREGRYEIGHLPEGEYSVGPRPRRLGGDTLNPFVRVLIASRSTQEVTVTSGQTTTVDLRVASLDE